jgi:hypothetical protein
VLYAVLLRLFPEPANVRAPQAARDDLGPIAAGDRVVQGG